MSTLTAPPAVQARLLDLQDLDSRLAQARTALQRIRADAELKARQEAVHTAEAALAELTAASEEADRQAAAASEKAAATRAHRDRTRTRLAAGTAGARDLVALQHEEKTLEALLGEHEEAALSAMQDADAAEQAAAAGRAGVEEARAAVEGRAAELRATGQRVTLEGRELTTRRAALAGRLPAPLVALYEKARAGNGGIGAARLEGRRSTASGTELSPLEAAALASLPAEAVAICPETGAILVRG